MGELDAAAIKSLLQGLRDGETEAQRLATTEITEQLRADVVEAFVAQDDNHRETIETLNLIAQMVAEYEQAAAETAEKTQEWAQDVFAQVADASRRVDQVSDMVYGVSRQVAGLTKKVDSLLVDGTLTETALAAVIRQLTLIQRQQAMMMRVLVSLALGRIVAIAN